MRAGGDAEECLHTDEVAPELNVGSLTAAIGLPRPRFFARSARKGVRRGEERRETLAWGQGDAGGRGEGNHLMRRRSWLQEHRREKQVGGGDPGGGGVLLAESHDS